jgi:phosphate transport system protein
MRDAYHRQLEAVGQDLATMAGFAGAALAKASKALCEADLATAQTVIRVDEALDYLGAGLDERTVDLLACQQPVASDLRTLMAALRMSADLERMGDLAVHVAKIARRRHPECAVPQALAPTVEAMGRTGVELAGKVAGIITSRDAAAARSLAVADDEVDRLHRELLTALLDGRVVYPVETAIDLALIGRFYERFADHAVSLARSLDFAVTGEAARPRPPA